MRRTFEISIMVLIVLNITAVILETEEALFLRYSGFFHGFEVFSIIVFSAEYVFRLWECTAEEKNAGFFVGRLRYALTPLALVDLAAIAPFYLPMLIPFDLRFVRVLRLLRFLRILKIGRYSKSLVTLIQVLKNKKEELYITVFAGLILLVFASSVMYFVEHSAQPKNFPSIPAAMWWGVTTLTTVGYGDLYPITPLGKFFGAIIAFLGIGLFAMPAGIVASGFTEILRKDVPAKCPHCGKEIHEK